MAWYRDGAPVNTTDPTNAPSESENVDSAPENSTESIELEITEKVALDASPSGQIAVKLFTGEPPLREVRPGPGCTP